MSVDLAQLTTAARKRLPKGTFAIPSQRAYPIPDKAHARNALSRVAQHGTPAQKKQVKRAVKRKFPDIGAANRDTAIKLAYALKEARARGMSLDMSAVQRYRHGWIPIGGEVAKAAKRGSVESRYPNANKGLVGDVNTGKLRKAKSPPKVKKLPPGIKGSLSTRKPRAPRGTHSVAGVKMHTELNSNR